MIRRCATILGFTFCVAAIALALSYGNDIRVAYHRLQMERHYEATFGTVSDLSGGSAGYELGDSFRKYERHRDKLVELGALNRNECVLRFLISCTEERRHFWGEICGKECPPNVEVIGDREVAGQPWKITVWCWRENSAEWDRYITKRDTAAYRDEFMRGDGAAL